MNGINRAIEHFGSQTILAEKLGISKQVVNSWVHGVKAVPSTRAIQIERLTGGEITIDDLIDIELPKDTQVA